jgi:hypothetical protein
LYFLSVRWPAVALHLHYVNPTNTSTNQYTNQNTNPSTNQNTSQKTNISAHGDSIEEANVNPTDPSTNQNTNQYSTS